jgi:hypothetical protein
MKTPKRHLITTLFAWNDQLWVLMAVFLMMFVLLVASVKKDADKKEDNDTTAGNMSIEIKWKYGLDADVDLWFQYAGSQEDPVFYNNKDTHRANLVRDDLGIYNDYAPENFENAFIRGLEAGDYTINLHLFSNRAGELPIDVDVRVTMKTRDDGSPTEIWKGKVTLREMGEELTVIRFKLDRKFKPFDLNSVFLSLKDHR